MSAEERVAASVNRAGRRKVSKRVTKALGSTSLMRIETAPRNAESMDGFVVGTGAKWVLVVHLWCCAPPWLLVPGGYGC